jgi:hypothetical protein
MQVLPLELFIKLPLTIIPENLRPFWNINGRDVFKSSQKYGYHYGCRDALGISQLLGAKKIDEVDGDFTFIKFV